MPVPAPQSRCRGGGQTTSLAALTTPGVFAGLQADPRSCVVPVTAALFMLLRALPPRSLMWQAIALLSSHLCEALLRGALQCCKE